MPEYIQPSNSYTSRLSLGVESTGLVGTVRFRLIDNDSSVDDPVYGPSTANIIEDPSGLGEYLFTGTAPATAGKYSRAWDTGPGTDLYFDDDLVVTSTAFSFVTTGNLYVQADELKEILTLQGTEFADLAIDIACETASRQIDSYKNTRYYPTEDETRYYTSDPGDQWIVIDDLSAFDSLELDFGDDGTYETTWTQNTQFRLEPINNPTDGRPWNRLVLKRGYRFPTGDAGIKLTGTFGWSEAPIQVKQAAILLANRFLVRNRQAPLDVLTVIAGESVSLAHLGNIDKDAKFLLDQLPGRSPLRSYQLT